MLIHTCAVWQVLQSMTAHEAELTYSILSTLLSAATAACNVRKLELSCKAASARCLTPCLRVFVCSTQMPLIAQLRDSMDAQGLSLEAADYQGCSFAYAKVPTYLSPLLLQCRPTHTSMCCMADGEAEAAARGSG